MRVTVVREIKADEFRASLTPAGARDLTRRCHKALAGAGSGFSDEDYTAAGASVVSCDDAWRVEKLICKVKEPVAAEYGRFRARQTLFAYLHLAADLPLTRALVDSGTTAIAYETVTAAGAAARGDRLGVPAAGRVQRDLR
jgi:alanine dehydrogenase